MSHFDALANTSLAGKALTREEALGVLRADDAELPALLAAAWRVRRHHHGNTVKVHVLMNAKRGGCAEDCGFCVQSLEASGGLEPYRLQDVEEILREAREAHARGAWKFCIVTATRGPSERDLDVVCEAVRRIKKTVPIRICASLGLLTPAKATRLAEAGVDRFNHNLESSERFFPEICSTHSWQDRVQTLRTAKASGMELCSGGIVGMGETDEDVVDLALAVRELDVDSIPVNFMMPTREGAPGAAVALTPAYALKVLCLYRLLNPSKDIRAAAGRELHLRALQPMALYAANSIFTDGYLNTPGQGISRDMAMIRDLGFETLQVPEASC
jgi:biotin synthase